MIEECSYVAFKTILRSIESDGTVSPILVEKNCFIGGGAMVLPGVTIGHNSIVGAGSVVFEDVPPYSIVAGNPARLIARDDLIGPYGRKLSIDERQKR
ncbi:acyltransferase [Erythrobacter sp. MTPC3]|uniref:acyltransferase n=1 Tax=Erythrobacter sp. MTPC3 TaxID=3056564 RepID=UPI0036F28809